MASFIPLSKNIHSKYYFKSLTNFISLKNQSACPVCIAEIKKLVTDWPLIFLKKPDGTISFNAMQGFLNEQNLFVDIEGNWLNKYIPAINRCLPFGFYRDEKNKKEDVLAFDEELNCLLENPEDDKNFIPIFEKNKQFSKSFSKHLDFLKSVIVNIKHTEKLNQELETFNLLKEWPIELKFKDGIKTMKGIYKIDEEKLLNLSSKSINQIYKSKSIELIYAQIFSQENVHKLAKKYIDLTNQEIIVDNKVGYREQVIEKGKQEKKKELNELVENLLNDE